MRLRRYSGNSIRRNAFEVTARRVIDESPLEVGRCVIDEVDNFGVEIIWRPGAPEEVEVVPALEAFVVDHVGQLVQDPLDVRRVRQVVLRSDWII